MTKKVQYTSLYGKNKDVCFLIFKCQAQQYILQNTIVKVWFNFKTSTRSYGARIIRHEEFQLKHVQYMVFKGMPEVQMHKPFVHKPKLY